MFKKHRHFVVFMLFLAGVINCLDRSTLSVKANQPDKPAVVQTQS